MAIELNKNNFKQEVFDSPIPVLVDFWASWCGPCQLLSPIIDEVSREFEGKIKVAKVNVDDEPELAQKYGIMSIPTILFFKSGVVVDSIVGAVPKIYLVKQINKILQ
ncbi:MAG: thioredoxin [candidate division WOR-3 bacterium]|nr:thioredoxin [candidate division WOR-3 bacterium]